MHQRRSCPPALSVVVITPDRYATVQRLVGHLRAQTVSERLEIVLVAPSLALLDHDAADLRAFAQVRLVEASFATTGQARAIGVRHATAPIVAVSEDHAFPVPGWAAALIEAHQADWAAVGAAIGNANPHSRVSWANLFIQHGPWVEPTAAGPMDDIPGHNSSYKRELLLTYGDRLDALLEAGTVLHWDLRARGYRLCLAPGARVDHLNMSRPRSFLKEQYYFSRLFAATRAADWSWRRRALYTLGAPLIPLVRLRRVLRDVRRSRRLSLLPAILPAMLAGLVAGALGEGIAYAAGPGAAPAAMFDLEFHRDRHITRRDRQALALSTEAAHATVTVAGAPGPRGFA